MKFSKVPVHDAEGAILAHATRGDGWTLKKGRRLSAKDCQILAAAGFEYVTAATLDSTDVHEDEAARRIAEGGAGDHIRTTSAFTGRCNLTAGRAGVVRINADVVDRVNQVDESMTIATVMDFTSAREGQTVGTVKIIPFSVEATAMDTVMKIIAGAGPPVSIVPFQPMSVALINTVLPSLKESVVAKTTALTTRRIGACGGTVDHVLSCPHERQGVSEAVAKAIAHEPDLIIVVGASVTVDRADVVPAGIVLAGGVIEHFGMPVDPGNLMLLARHASTPVLVLPGCARSPKLNGIDWILDRLAARLPVTRDVITGLGVGGLLVDSPARPLPRDDAVRAAPERKQTQPIAAVVLAAGQSRRMGGVNKLLELVDGEPLIRRTVETAIKANTAPVVVVTGHQADEVKEALVGLDVATVHNPEFERGLSTSLRVGLNTLPEPIMGALVCLGDMPDIGPAHLKALVDQFDPEAGRAIGVPVHRGKRGNPTLWARRFFDAMTEIAGDVGARHLIGANADLVYEVEFEDTAVLTDLDTPEQWARFRGNQPAE